MITMMSTIVRTAAMDTDGMATCVFLVPFQTVMSVVKMSVLNAEAHTSQTIVVTSASATLTTVIFLITRLKILLTLASAYGHSSLSTDARIAQMDTSGVGADGNALHALMLSTDVQSVTSMETIVWCVMMTSISLTVDVTTSMDLSIAMTGLKINAMLVMLDGLWMFMETVRSTVRL